MYRNRNFELVYRLKMKIKIFVLLFYTGELKIVGSKGASPHLWGGRGRAKVPFKYLLFSKKVELKYFSALTANFCSAVHFSAFHNSN